jgi:hypothetical protein
MSTPIIAMLILFHPDHQMTFVKGVPKFGATAIHSEPLHQMISIDEAHIINKPSFTRPGRRCGAAVFTLLLGVDA